MAAKNTKKMALNNSSKTMSDPTKMQAGKKVQRPAILEDKNNKVNLLTQSKHLLSAKKGKSDISSLPQGVQDSLKNKERIDGILNQGTGQISVDDIRKKYDIKGKPITLKVARLITEERNQFFEENRKKSANSKTKKPLSDKKSLTVTKK